jgi:hypothetical protein
VARLTGKRIGLDTATRMAIDAEKVARILAPLLTRDELS